MSSSRNEKIIHCLDAMMMGCCTMLLDRAAKREEAKQRKKQRRLWIEWRKLRQQKRTFHLLMNELRLTNNENYLRMDVECFHKILNFIKDDIGRENSQLGHQVIPVEEKLAVCLRFLATGESFQCLDLQTTYSTQYISDSLVEVAKAVYKRMQPLYIKFPTSHQKWLDIEEKMNNKWQFPHCLGAMGIKHIPIIPRKSDGIFYLNGKGFNSMVLLAIADADYKFVFIEVGNTGRVSVDELLELSNVFRLFDDTDQTLPSDSDLGANRKLPYVFLADDTYSLRKNLMTPYPIDLSDHKAKIFNLRLNHAKQCIQRAFIILSNRFRILNAPIQLEKEKVMSIVLCCCVLHNFLIENSNLYRHQLNEMDDNQQSTTLTANDSDEFQEDIFDDDCGITVREQFAEYFVNEGSVSWQNMFV